VEMLAREQGGGIPCGRVNERSFALERWLRILGVSELSEVESTTPAICCLLRPPESSHPSTPLAFEPPTNLCVFGSFEILSILWRLEELHIVGFVCVVHNAAKFGMKTGSGLERAELSRSSIRS
jgi:hypothetical protein